MSLPEPKQHVEAEQLSGATPQPPTRPESSTSSDSSVKPHNNCNHHNNNNNDDDGDGSSSSSSSGISRRLNQQQQPPQVWSQQFTSAILRELQTSVQVNEQRDDELASTQQKVAMLLQRHGHLLATPPVMKTPTPQATAAAAPWALRPPCDSATKVAQVREHIIEPQLTEATAQALLNHASFGHHQLQQLQQRQQQSQKQQQSSTNSSPSLSLSAQSGPTSSSQRSSGRHMCWAILDNDLSELELAVQRTCNAKTSMSRIPDRPEELSQEKYPETHCAPENPSQDVVHLEAHEHPSPNVGSTARSLMHLLNDDEEQQTQRSIDGANEQLELTDNPIEMQPIALQHIDTQPLYLARHGMPLSGKVKSPTSSPLKEALSTLPDISAVEAQLAARGKHVSEESENGVHDLQTKSEGINFNTEEKETDALHTEHTSLGLEALMASTLAPVASYCKRYGQENPHTGGLQEEKSVTMHSNPSFLEKHHEDYESRNRAAKQEGVYSPVKPATWDHFLGRLHQVCAGEKEVYNTKGKQMHSALRPSDVNSGNGHGMVDKPKEMQSPGATACSSVNEDSFVYGLNGFIEEEALHVDATNSECEDSQHDEPGKPKKIWKLIAMNDHLKASLSKAQHELAESKKLLDIRCQPASENQILSETICKMKALESELEQIKASNEVHHQHQLEELKSRSSRGSSRASSLASTPNKSVRVPSAPEAAAHVAGKQSGKRPDLVEDLQLLYDSFHRFINLPEEQDALADSLAKCYLDLHKVVAGSSTEEVQEIEQKLRQRLRHSSPTIGTFGVGGKEVARVNELVQYSTEDQSGTKSLQPTEPSINANILSAISDKAANASEDAYERLTAAQGRAEDFAEHAAFVRVGNEELASVYLLAADAEKRVAEAENRVVAAERRSQWQVRATTELEQRVTTAETRAHEAEKRQATLQKHLQGAQGRYRGLHGLRKGKNLGDRVRYESPQEEDDEDILAHTGDDKERIALGELLHLLKDALDSDRISPGQVSELLTISGSSVVEAAKVDTVGRKQANVSEKQNVHEDLVSELTQARLQNDVYANTIADLEVQIAEVKLTGHKLEPVDLYAENERLRCENADLQAKLHSESEKESILHIARDSELSAANDALHARLQELCDGVELVVGFLSSHSEGNEKPDDRTDNREQIAPGSSRSSSNNGHESFAAVISQLKVLLQCSIDELKKQDRSINAILEIKATDDDETFLLPPSQANTQQTVQMYPTNPFVSPNMKPNPRPSTTNARANGNRTEHSSVKLNLVARLHADAQENRHENSCTNTSSREVSTIDSSVQVQSASESPSLLALSNNRREIALKSQLKQGSPLPPVRWRNPFMSDDDEEDSDDDEDNSSERQIYRCKQALQIDRDKRERDCLDSDSNTSTVSRRSRLHYVSSSLIKSPSAEEAAQAAAVFAHAKNFARQ